MRRSAAVISALALDAFVGDPRGLPHPVRFMGCLALALEGPARKAMGDTRRAGMAAVAAVVAASVGAALGVRALARRAHPLLGDLAEIILLSWALAPRDLTDHALAVRSALRAGDLDLARRRVSRMVSRDTDRLDVAGVVRAATESVAENTVDGVAAPLLYAVLGGAPLAVAYKAASTLDSTFGYRTERYRDFGWAAARLDDAAACLPARATPPFVALAAILCRERPLSAWRICRRDGRRHASPNAGLAEAAFAGALGVQLGGPAMREGQWIDSPLLGDPRQLPTPAHITRAVRLMYVCTALQAATLCAVPRLRQWRRTCARFSTPQEVR